MKWEEIVMLVGMVLGLLFGLTMAHLALGFEKQAFEARQGYVAAMNEIEAINRTKGWISSAYVCRSKK